MERTFLLDAAQHPLFASLQLPGPDHTFAARSGKWGNKGRAKLHKYTSEAHATDAYLAKIDSLREEGYVEIPPWMTFRRGEDVLEILPPHTLPELRRRQSGRMNLQTFESMFDAICAFNDLVLESRESGFSFQTPEYEPLPAATYEEILVHEANTTQLKKSYWRSLQTPSLERGPEHWYKEGALSSLNYQLQTQKQGHVFVFIDSELRKLCLDHRDNTCGLNYNFRPDGRIESLGPKDQGERTGTWYELDHENHTTRRYHTPGISADVTWARLDGTLEQQKRFDEDGSLQEILFYDASGTLNQRRERRDDGWSSEYFHPDGVTVREAGLLNSNSDRCGIWKQYDAQGAEIHQETPIEELFSCLERGTYLPTPTPERQYTSLYASTSAAELNLPETLEDHLGRLLCLAEADLESVRPQGAKARGVWTHTSDAGSTLKLKRRKGHLSQADVLRADGTCAATATYHVKARLQDTAISVAMFHEDGVSQARWGEYVASSYAGMALSLRRDGWWFDLAASGQTTRAQHFSMGTYNLNADHHFGAPPQPLSDEAFETLFGEARSLASQPPDRERFLAICALLERGSETNTARAANELVPYLQSALKAWPSRIRMAPLLWINRLIRGTLPLEALHLTSALSLTAAVTTHYLNSPNYPLLLQWLSSLPEDAPAPEGISMSFRDEVAQALQAAKGGQPEAYHPDGDLDLDETFHIDPDDMDVLFKNPLFRGARVLDFSWEPTSHDFDRDHQGILDGRGLTLGKLMSRVPSPNVEVLDLWGQVNEPGDQIKNSYWGNLKKGELGTLRELNVGGGHPIGDQGLKEIASFCPNLERLSLRPGLAGDMLSGYDFDDWEDGEGRESVYGRIQEHWRVYGNDDIEKMRIGRGGWRALGKLKPLTYVCLGDVQEPHGLPAKVEVLSLSAYSYTESPRVALWDAHFDK